MPISKSARERAIQLAEQAKDIQLLDELVFGYKLARKVWFWQSLCK